MAKSLRGVTADFSLRNRDHTYRVATSHCTVQDARLIVRWYVTDQVLKGVGPSCHWSPVEEHSG